MSVAAMTMDDQRPLMNSYEKMSKQYEQSLHVASHSAGNISSAAPPSGPASPTPSGSEEPPQHQFHHSHHHHHHTHHHHPQQQQQQVQYHPHHNHLQTTIAEQQQQHQSEHQQLHEQQQVEQQILQESSVVAEAVAAAEQRQRLLEDEIESLKVEQTRLTQQCADAQRREKILMRRLANKEQEFQDYVTQIAEYKAAQAPSALALRSALLDPAVNLLFEKLKKELKATKAKLEETQNELSAWKFTPDSNTGKRLMAKCRLLYQENEELGKMTSNGRLAKLETELAMQKSFSEEVKKSQSELDDFLQELDEDVEGMQSTIIFLQQELKTTRERIQILEKENYQLKNGIKDNEIIDTIAVTATTTSSPHNGDGNLIINEMNTTPYQIPAAATLNTTNNEYKYHQYQKQPILETINENECLHSAATHTEYYNGIVEEPHQRLTTAVTTIPIIPNMQIIPNPTPLLIGNEDCGSSNSSNTSNTPLRTVAARKRNYDETSGASPDYTMAQTLPNNIPTAMQQQQVSSPRTLPPKKSKLRITTSRSSDQLNELVNDMVVATTPPYQNIYNSPTTPINLMETVVLTTGLSSEEVIRENNNSNTLVETINDASVPQRIMTRRRSLRMQQNGNGDNSNH